MSFKLKPTINNPNPIEFFLRYVRLFSVSFIPNLYCFFSINICRLNPKIMWESLISYFITLFSDETQFLFEYKYKMDIF
jgi:hypothetical protein